MFAKLMVDGTHLVVPVALVHYIQRNLFCKDNFAMRCACQVLQNGPFPVVVEFLYWCNKDGSRYDFSEWEFRVVEHSSYFAVEHIASGKEHHMSDGVDAVYMELDYEEFSCGPGMFGFVEIWGEALNSTGSETYEAYFPELIEE